MKILKPPGLATVLLGLVLPLFLAINTGAAPSPAKQAGYLIRNWLAGEGVSENSALAVAQTVDRYLWVGSSDGLLRFNGLQFERADQIYPFPSLGSVILTLSPDRSGRLWAGTDAGVVMMESGQWKRLGPTNLILRTVAETPTGRLFLGSLEGELFEFDGKDLRPREAPPGVTRNGIFLGNDAKDGRVWLANRGFVGLWTGQEWKRLGPETTPPDSIVAGPALGGGFWVYGAGMLRLYRESEARQTISIPEIDQPRQLVQDRQGWIWIASNTSGLIRVGPDGSIHTITSTNGLTHNSSRSLLEDAEGNLWLGTSSGGLHRLRERCFDTFGLSEGLPDRLVRTVAEGSPGQILLGTHVGGTARIENGKVNSKHAGTGDQRGPNAWSVLRDSSGKVWIGTYLRGLFVEEGGAERNFPLPPETGSTIYALYEDSHRRIWVGTLTGPAVIENGVARAVEGAPALAGASVRCFAEEQKTGAMWMGTFRSGLFRVEGNAMRSFGRDELGGMRISSLASDDHGCVWAGVFGAGLACWRDGIMMRVRPEAGLPAKTVGSILQDGLGYFWLGTDRGIVRVSSEDLHRAAEGKPRAGMFNLFNEQDGLRRAECSEGYQPAAVREGAGRLWFATLGGVATVDPRAVRINTNPPPVVIEKVWYRKSGASESTLVRPGAEVNLPPGSTEVEVHCAVLSFAAPEKVQCAFQMEGLNYGWVNLGSEREIRFHTLNPGKFRLRVKAANNDGLWNEGGTELRITLQPHFWQTAWFAAMTALATAGGIGGTVWRFQHGKIQRQEQRLLQERALAEEKAHAQQTLQKSESALRAFMDALPTPAFLVNAGGTLAAVNEALARNLGRARAGLLGQNYYGMLPPEVAVARKAEIDRAFNSGAEIRVEEASAGRHYIHYLSPVLDANGAVSGVAVFALDITERNLAEQVRLRTEARFRSLVENSLDIITIVDAEGIIRFASPSALSVLGYTPTELTGRSCLEFSHPDDVAGVKARLERVFGGAGQFTELEHRLRHVNGAWRTMESKGRLLADEETPLALVNTRDLTERRALEEHLRQVQKMEALGQLSGGVAHDFNNILGIIIGHISLLQMERDIGPETRASLDEIGQSAERAANLTRQLLAFSRRQVMRARPLNLNEHLRHVSKMLERLLGEEVRMELNLHPAPLIILGDPVMLDQVLMNLAVNARDAMAGTGSLFIETSEKLITQDDLDLIPEITAGRHAALHVRDTGCGMSGEVKAHLFEPFFTTKEPGQGTGLGLATVFGIIKQHHGTVRVQSEIGQGTVFQILLPFSMAKDDPAASATPPADARGGDETILLVEDDASLRALTRSVLKKHGYNVLETANGIEACRIWGQHSKQIGLLLTDIVMPEGMNGRDLAARLQRENPALPVIFTSGYSAELAGRELNLREGQNFLPKPSLPSQILEMVRCSLDQRKS